MTGLTIFNYVVGIIFNYVVGIKGVQRTNAAIGHRLD